MNQVSVFTCSSQNTDQLPDDAEVAESNIIARYAQRAHTLENVCLAEYAAYYDSRTGAEETSRSDDEFVADYSTHHKTHIQQHDDHLHVSFAPFIRQTMNQRKKHDRN